MAPAARQWPAGVRKITAQIIQICPVQLCTVQLSTVQLCTVQITKCSEF
jgi:hypothetical protein